MKTSRLTLLTTPDFKAFLGAEAARAGVSVAEWVRSRCEPKPDMDEALLAALSAELRLAVCEAQRSLGAGLAEAERLTSELQSRRAPAESPPPPPAARSRKARKATAGAPA